MGLLHGVPTATFAQRPAGCLAETGTGVARSRHLSHPGARIDVTVLGESVLTQRSERHGTVRRCELIDADANRFVWWQTAGAPLHRGEVVTLTGRVKRHTRFAAGAVTVLSHCRRP